MADTQQCIIEVLTTEQRTQLKVMTKVDFDWRMTITPCSKELLWAVEKRISETRVAEFMVMSPKHGVVLIATEPLQSNEVGAAQELLKQIVLEEAVAL